MPVNIDREICEMKVGGKMCRRFIEILQIYPDPNADKDMPPIQHNNDKIKKAVNVGLEIGKALLEKYGSRKDVLLTRYRVLLSALENSNPVLRLVLLNDEIDPKDFV